MFGAAAMGRSEAGWRAARPEKATRRAPRATAQRRLDGGTASMEEGARSAVDGGGGGVRRGGGRDGGRRLRRRTPPDEVIARGRRPAPEGTTTGSGGARGRGRGADVRGAGRRRSEEAGAEDGGVDRLGRRT